MTNAEFIARYRQQQKNMSTRIKPKTLATRTEFNDALARAVEIDVNIRTVIARRDRAIHRLQAAFAVKLLPLQTERDAQVSLAEKYALTHRAELLPDEKKKKSGETATATFGFRTGNRAVKCLSRVKEEDAIAELESLRLDKYVRTVKELDKAGILRDAVSDDKALTRPVLDPAGNQVMVEGAVVTEEVALNAIGLKIAQPETFFVEAKVESAETMKASEARAA